MGNRLVNCRMMDRLDRNISNLGFCMMCVLRDLDVASSVMSGVIWLVMRTFSVVRLLNVVVRTVLIWCNIRLHIVIGIILRGSACLSRYNCRNNESKSVH